MAEAHPQRKRQAQKVVCDVRADRVQLSEDQFSTVIDFALTEDIGPGDVTSEALISPELYGPAYMQSKANGILAGIDIVRGVFLRADSSIRFEALLEDGAKLQPGDRIATIYGRISSILKAERVALNFVQRLSGTATLTSQFVAKVKDCNTVILDTRKTTPGLRLLEKYAVRVGGGQNHRMHLGDGILIKDNHIAALRSLGMSLKDIVAKARQNAPQGMKIEVEATTVEEALETVKGGADMVLLDNMSPEDMRRAVSLLPQGMKTEASGGINLKNIREVAMTGVNFISIGALTHSVKSLDISIEMEMASLEMKGSPAAPGQNR